MIETPAGSRVVFKYFLNYFLDRNVLYLLYLILISLKNGDWIIALLGQNWCRRCQKVG